MSTECVVEADFEPHTVAEADFMRQLREVTFRNFPLPLRIRVTRDEFLPEMYEMRASIMVPDRDTGEATQVVRSCGFLRRVEMMRVQQQIYFEVVALLHHEVDESFHVGGVRVRDPHKGEGHP
jgi:hypothetical protein